MKGKLCELQKVLATVHDWPVCAMNHLEKDLVSKARFYWFCQVSY